MKTAKQKAKEIAQIALNQILKDDEETFPDLVHNIEQALQEAAKVEWPERLKFIVEMGIRKFTDERSEYGEGYDMGALDAYDYLKSRMSKEG